MVRSIVGAICALVTLALLPLTAIGSQEVLTGTVKAVDERSGVILFEDGRQVQVMPGATVITEKPVDRLGALTPGTSVVVIVPDAVSASPRFSIDAPEPNELGLPSPQAP
jgi:hypothetical protein